MGTFLNYQINSCISYMFLRSCNYSNHNTGSTDSNKIRKNYFFSTMKVTRIQREKVMVVVIEIFYIYLINKMSDGGTCTMFILALYMQIVTQVSSQIIVADGRT